MPWEEPSDCGKLLATYPLTYFILIILYIISVRLQVKDVEKPQLEVKKTEKGYAFELA